MRATLPGSKKAESRLAIEKLLREKYYQFSGTPAAAVRDIARVLKGEPLDYVIGWVPFSGVHIDLSLRPFIPRPETEYWVGEAIKDLKGRPEKTLNVLDTFAGSGCIGSAILKHIPQSRVTFAEKMPRFAEQIKINVRINNFLARRCRILCSDFFSKVSGKFDIILANPPYVGAESYLDPLVKKYEPRVAYYGGYGGISAIAQFLKEAWRFVRPGGEIWMEFGSSQKAGVKRMLGRFGYTCFSFRCDQYQRPRYVRIRL